MNAIAHSIVVLVGLAVLGGRPAWAGDQPQGPEVLADVADVPALDLTVTGNNRMRYFLMGPRKDAVPPKTGFRLVVVMPGGDGGAGFHPFVRRLYKHAMTEEFLVAQPVAVRWSSSQQTVWPTKINPEQGQAFATEEFVEAVIKDVRRRHTIDERFVFTLSWSSSGPAAYAVALQEKTPVTGSYIAMSVYRREWHPLVAGAKGRVFFIEHSREDRICPYDHALTAQRELHDAGARVRLVTYEGGHGWHGPIYPRVSAGLAWLVQQAGGQK
jgi:predicted esterase